MQKSIFEIFKSFIYPFSATVLAISLIMNPGAIPVSFKPLVVFLPYLAILAGLGLSFKFNRIKEFFVFLHLGIAYWLYIDFYSPEAWVDVLKNHIVFHAVTIFIPFNLIVLSFLKNSPLISPDSIVRFFVMGVQALAAFWIVFIDNTFVAAVVSTRHIAALQIFNISETSIAFSLIAISIFSYKMFRYRTFEEVGFLVAVIPMILAFLAVDTPRAFSLLIAASAISLIITTIFNSFNIAYIDELTGIPGRRAMREKMANLTGKYTIAMIDIDHFKSFNDTHGHDTGDDVLKRVARKIATVTGGGKAYRYGGEEFAVIFPGKPILKTIPHLEQIRKKVAGHRFAIRNLKKRPDNSIDGVEKRAQTNRAPNTVSVTISIGVCEKGLTHKNPDDVMKGADEALYRAKNNGRNNVSH